MADWIEPGADIRVLMSPDGPYDAPVSDLVDVTEHVLGTDPLTITRGRSGQFDHFQAGECSFTLRNNQRWFDPELGAGHVVFPGDFTSNISTPDHTDWDITGRIAVGVEFNPADFTPGSSQVLIGRWSSAVSNDSWRLSLLSSGRLSFMSTPTGDPGASVFVTAAAALPAQGWLAVWVDYIPNDGAGNRVAQFYTATSLAEWPVPFGPPVTVAGATSIFAGSSPVEIGSGEGGSNFSYEGMIRRASVYNGALIGGTLIADPDFRSLTAGATSTTDSFGKVWTFNDNVDVIVGSPARYVSLLHPRTRVEIHASWEDNDRTLFTGYVEGWPQRWTKTTGVVPIVAKDRLAVLAQDSAAMAATSFLLGDPVTGVLGTGVLSGPLEQETTGARVGALLSLAGFPPDETDLADGLTDVIATNPDGNLLTLIEDTVDAEAGFLFVDKTGRFVFLDRHSRFETSRLADVQATFAEDVYASLAIDHDLTEVRNDARFVRDTPAVDPFVTITGDLGDTPVVEEPEPLTQIARDEASIRRHGRIVHSQTVPVVNDAQALGRAEFWLLRYARSHPRPTPVEVKPRRNPAVLFPQVLDLELLDRVQIDRTPLGIPPTSTYVGLVQRLEHTITNADWTTTVEVSTPDVQDGDTFLVLGDGSLGLLGTGTLAY